MKIWTFYDEAGPWPDTSAVPVYYHGGAPNLTRVLPPRQTGAPSCSDFGAEKVHCRDAVYLTTLLDAAKMFAALHPSMRGWVYEVRPVGTVRPDPDYSGPPGESVEADAAEVVRVMPMTPKDRSRIRAMMMRGLA